MCVQCVLHTVCATYSVCYVCTCVLHTVCAMCVHVCYIQCVLCVYMCATYSVCYICVTVFVLSGWSKHCAVMCVSTCLNVHVLHTSLLLLLLLQCGLLCVAVGHKELARLYISAIVLLPLPPFPPPSLPLGPSPLVPPSLPPMLCS